MFRVFHLRNPEFVLLYLVSISLVLQSLQAEPVKNKSNYILTPGDVISVQVFGQPDLHDEQEISNEGAINLGLIGSINLTTLTVAEAEAKIRGSYMDKQYLKDPQVIIKVVQYSPKLVSVLGQVRKPGSVQLPKDVNAISLAQLISMVGDFTDIAKQNKIRIVRKSAEGEEKTIIVDMSDIGEKKGNDRADIDFLVYPNDVIFVPERWF